MATRVKERFHRVRWGVGKGREIIKLHSGRRYNTLTFVSFSLLSEVQRENGVRNKVLFKLHEDEDWMKTRVEMRYVEGMSQLLINFIMKSVWLPISHNIKEKNIFF